MGKDKRKRIPKGVVTEEEMNLPPEQKETLNEYRHRHSERLKELHYEQRNGYRPPRPWYER